MPEIKKVLGRFGRHLCHLCHIVLGQQYNSYIEGLASLGLESLENRRKILCRSFAVKSAQNKKFENLFNLNEVKKSTRLRKSKFKKMHARTKQLEKSSIPYLTDLLNDE